MKSTAKEIFNTLLNDKKVKATTGDDTSFEYTKIPFNIPQLDKITNGGIPRKDLLYYLVAFHQASPTLLHNCVKPCKKKVE